MLSNQRKLKYVMHVSPPPTPTKAWLPVHVLPLQLGTSYRTKVGKDGEEVEKHAIDYVYIIPFHEQYQNIRSNTELDALLQAQKRLRGRQHGSTKLIRTAADGAYLGGMHCVVLIQC